MKPQLSPFPTWPPEWPEIAEAVAQAVARGDWGRYRGPNGTKLVERIGELAGVRHARLLSSGSAAVEVALRIAGVSAGQQVALCGYDYPGNFRAIELVGARPLLVDAAKASYSIDPQPLETLDPAAISAVLVSHLYGVPADMPRIAELCRENGWRLIEDACQVPGMRVHGRPAGSWGDVGVFSFGGSKPLTAGNGGALLSNHDAIASKWRAMLDRPSDALPLSELQAAVLLPQLERLAHYNQLRSQTLDGLYQSVPWLGGAIGGCRPAAEATCYKLAWMCPDRDTLIRLLTDRGLPVGQGYRSMHRSSNRRCGKVGPLSRCRDLGEQLVLLDHSALLATGTQREFLIASLNAPGLN